MSSKTNFDKFVEKQMQDPEFRAYYILAKEKAKLEFLIADLKETINTDFEKKSIMKRVRQISKHVNSIGVY